MQGSLPTKNRISSRTVQYIPGRHRPWKIRSAVLWAKQKSAVTSNPVSTHPWVCACDRVTDSHPPTNEPCRQTLLLAGAPGCPAGSTTGLLQWDSLQRSLVMAPAGYPTAPLGTTVETTRQDHGSATQPKNSRDKAKNKLKSWHPPPDRGKEGTRRWYKKPWGTDSSGLSNHSRQNAFLGLCFNISWRIRHTIKHIRTELGSWLLSPKWRRKKLHWGRTTQTQANTQPKKKRRKECRKADEDRSRGCHTLCKSGECVT